MSTIGSSPGGASICCDCARDLQPCVFFDSTHGCPGCPCPPQGGTRSSPGAAPDAAHLQHAAAAPDAIAMPRCHPPIKAARRQARPCRRRREVGRAQDKAGVLSILGLAIIIVIRPSFREQRRDREQRRLRIATQELDIADAVERWDAHKKAASAASSSTPSSSAMFSSLVSSAAAASAERWDVHKKRCPPQAEPLDDDESSSSTGSYVIDMEDGEEEILWKPRAMYAGPGFVVAAPSPTMLPVPTAFWVPVA